LSSVRVSVHGVRIGLRVDDDLSVGRSGGQAGSSVRDVAERFRMLAPEVGQTFLIGDGRGRAFRVPGGATRVFLGFADAYSDGHFYQGNPGYYGNNGGHLCVAVKPGE
jgi:hypothetical protein